MRNLLLALGLTVLLVGPAIAQIANNYPGDVGIENDPNVLMVDRLNDSVAAIQARSSPASRQNQSAMIADVPPGSPSTLSLRTRIIGGNGTTTQDLVKTLRTVCPPSTCTEVYTRIYIKHPTVTPFHHVGLWTIGQVKASPDQYDFLPGTCCSLPTGTGVGSVFYVGAEPGSGSGGQSAWDLYAGWPEMRISPDNVNFYGNTFIADSVTIAFAVWNLYEVRIKMNTPTTSRNGEMQAWINGTEVANLGLGFPLGSWNQNIWQPGVGSTPFDGFRWRTGTDLEITNILLNHYADLVATGVNQDVQWSHLVVARQRIGAITTANLPNAPTNLRFGLLLPLVPVVAAMLLRRRVHHA